MPSCSLHASTARNAHRREIRQFLSLHLSREGGDGREGGGASCAGAPRDGEEKDEGEDECEGEEGTPRVYSVGRKSNTTKADIITDPANGLRLGDGVGIFVDDDLREHMVTVLMALMALMVLVVQCCAMLC